MNIFKIVVYFTNLLKDKLVASKARIINVSSSAQAPGHMNFDDLILEKKLVCNLVLISRIFDKRTSGRGEGR